MDDMLKDAPSSQHYKQCVIEPIEYIEANGLSFHVGSVIKYVTRYEHKGGMDDLKKAQFYITRLMQLARSEGTNAKDNKEDKISAYLGSAHNDAASIKIQK